MMSFSVSEQDPAFLKKPYVDGDKILSGGMVVPWGGPVEDVTSPILDANGQRIVIGRIAQMDQAQALKVAEAAKAAWNNGRGVWPQMSLRERMGAIHRLVAALKEKREEIVTTLMWEICKNTADAAAEFDRTILFIEATLQAVQEMDRTEGQSQVVSGIRAKVRRGAVGTMLALGPFNYPFNETYTTLIPALLMGNVVVMKIPTVGGLAHVLTMEAYAASLPAGVVNFISGPGRVTLSPVMETGPDIFAFIGGSKAADTLLQAHPAPHRLRLFLSLEGKNLGIVCKDADLSVAVEQCVVGSTTFNGQRCTALKLLFVHEEVAGDFVQRMGEKVDALAAGLPWEHGVQITPLPEPKKIEYLQGLVDDALAKGARVVNAKGGRVEGNIFFPALVYPVTSEMRLYHEEQFGPVIPVATFTEERGEVLRYVEGSRYGQQASVFSLSSDTIAEYVDLLATAVGRVNVNTQCGRSPDVFPFSGRRSSANGTLSVTEALRTFSIETVVAGKSSEVNDRLMHETDGKSRFLAAL